MGTTTTVHNALVFKLESLVLQSTIYHSCYNHTAAFGYEHLSNDEYLDQKTRPEKPRRNSSTNQR